MQTAYMSLGEACERLRIPPRTFRQLMADFGDLLEAPRPSADGRLQELSVETVNRLHDILELRSRGVSVEAIRARLTAGSLTEPVKGAGAEAEVAATAEAALPVQRAEHAAPPAPTAPREPTPMPSAHSDRGSASVPPPPPAAPAGVDTALMHRHSDLLEKLERLTHELSQSEKRRVDDRDRLLTVLLKTQVEIQQLRQQMAAQVSRRDRKQQSWVARWFA